ncbi:MAG: ComEC/Rec2 family competence protein, partial [Gammaproteobacteria bacterium]
MFKVAVAFTLGICILTVFATLPHWYWIFSIVPTVLIGLKYPRSILMVSLLLGFLWGLVHAYLNLYPELDKSLEGIDLEVTGQIVSIPSVQGRSTRFEFSINKAQTSSDGEIVVLPKKVRLNWYGNTPVLKIGEMWQFRVRLKRPWGYANLGSFDYEKWLFEHEIRATGYVRAKGNHQRIQATNIFNPAYYLRAVL